MELFRYATSVYGNRVLLGGVVRSSAMVRGGRRSPRSWPMQFSSSSCRPPTIPGPKGGPQGILAMSSHATTSPASVASSAEAVGRIQRHKLVDRIYHWVMAICILTLLATSLLPIVGWKFAWLTIHWITGLIVTAAVIFHIIRCPVLPGSHVHGGGHARTSPISPLAAGPANTIWRRSFITWPSRS